MLKIYGVPISVHTRKVIVTAIEKQLDYENDPVIPFTPPPGWNELSPTGRIPAFADGEVTLCDSSVICAYLERTRPGHPVYPHDTREYVTALWFEEYADGTIFREVVHGLFFNKVIRPNILKQESDQAAVNSILNEARPTVFAYLERSLNGEYLAGNRFSVADIAVISNLVNYHYLGFDIDACKHPKLASYFGRQLRHPSIASALAMEQTVAAGMGLDHRFLASRAGVRTQ
jgi:glutathione S-transferase